MMSQLDAPWDLVFLSQEPGQAYSETEQMYNYDFVAGAGSTVYIMDTGLDLEVASTQLPPLTRWLFPPIDNDALRQGVTNEVLNDGGPSLHGTHMALKAVGSTYGVAKAASLVVVRDPSDKNGNPRLTLAAVVSALNTVYKDVTKRKLQKKAVLNMSLCKHDHLTHISCN